MFASLPHVSPAQAAWAAQRWPNMDAAQLEQARTLYEKSCSDCHAIVFPKDHSLNEWPRYLNKMAPKAKITEAEKEQIWRYIVAASQPV